jgi:hypothetical protein
MAGGTPLRIDDELVLRARIEAEASDRSVTAQIEHWVKLGMALEDVLAHRQAVELKRKRGPSVADALATARSSAAQEKALALLNEAGQPRYGVDPDRPGYLIRVMPDGTKTSGRFVNRMFVPTADEDDGQ